MSTDYTKIIQEIKFKLQIGSIDYYQAKKEADPIIAEMNKKGKEIAKRFGQKFRPFNFASLMR